MSFSSELKSWLSITRLQTATAPVVGDQAPSTERLTFPREDGKAAVISFLRHCGCPFAEKTFRSLRAAAESAPNVHCIAVSHSDQEATETWLKAIGGPGEVEIIVDVDRALYARWGLGVSEWTHVLSLATFRSLYNLYKEEGISNRPTESGSRWQTAGTWAIDGEGNVTFGGVAEASQDLPDFTRALASL